MSPSWSLLINQTAKLPRLTILHSDWPPPGSAPKHFHSLMISESQHFKES